MKFQLVACLALAVLIGVFCANSCVEASEELKLDPFQQIKTFFEKPFAVFHDLHDALRGLLNIFDGFLPTKQLLGGDKNEKEEKLPF